MSTAKYGDTTMIRGNVLESIERQKLDRLFEGVQPERKGIHLLSALAWTLPDKESVRIRKEEIAAIHTKTSPADPPTSDSEIRTSHAVPYGLPSFKLDLTRHHSTGETRVITSAWFTQLRHGEVLNHIDEIAGTFHIFDESELKPDADANTIFQAYDLYRKENSRPLGPIGRKHVLMVAPLIFTAAGVTTLTDELAHEPVIIK